MEGDGTEGGDGGSWNRGRRWRGMGELERGGREWYKISSEQLDIELKANLLLLLFIILESAHR